MLESQIQVKLGDLPGSTAQVTETPLPGIGAAAADGTVAGLSVVDAVHLIDPSVLAAIEFSTSEHLHNLASIDAYVHDHFFAAPVQSADGWFERLTGYVAEQKAASALEATGHHVQFAPTANQPVWDLIVDGHRVQVKEGLAGVKDYLASHPGIDIYTSHEAAASVKDPLVHGLDALDADQIHEATSQTLDGINDVFDPGFSIPYITLAFSSWRELKLLVNGMTTFQRATKHVAMDVIGVGGGAWVGAKGGALAGAVAGPWGAAIGACVGAILGAISGKAASKSIRYRPYARARDAYNEAIACAQARVNSSVEASQAKVSSLQADYQAKFLSHRQEVEQQARDEITRLRLGFNCQLAGFAEAFPSRLDELMAQLDKEEQEVLRTMPHSIWGFLFPSPTEHRRAAVKKWFRRARKIVRDEKVLFSRTEKRSWETLFAEVRRFLERYTFELETLEMELSRVTNAFASAEQRACGVQGKATQELEQRRSTLVRELSGKLGEMHAQIVELVRRWNRTIASRKADLLKEARPLGISI
jgi:microcompartment protein CcmK/EutM